MKVYISDRNLVQYVKHYKMNVRAGSVRSNVLERIVENGPTTLDVHALKMKESMYFNPKNLS